MCGFFWKACVCVHVLVLPVGQPLMQQFAARVENVCLLSCVVGREEEVSLIAEVPGGV